LTDERAARLMQRALSVARHGSPGPQPRAAVLIARGDGIVARARRERGAPHPELVALRRAGPSARGATLYATLEPCAACAEAMIAAGVRAVAIGCSERGAGKRKLQAAGVKVIDGVLRPRAAALIADYTKFRARGLPYVTLKSAVTLDGRTAARSGESRWITGAEARREVHRMRADSDAVLVGVGTVLADDPELTVRDVRGENPLRVVLDSRLRTPPSAKLVQGARLTRTLILHAKTANPRRAAKLMAAGVELLEVAAAESGAGVALPEALRALAQRGVVRLLVEGGAHVHAGLLEAELVDRAAVFVAPRILGDAQGYPLAAGTVPQSLAAECVIEQPEIVRLGDDVLVRGAVSFPKRAKRRVTKAGPRKAATL
jgi:diaminohydroxyphosphoribosylaminopyrimidine deaminase/5-amino-6-(5-phosphoribosylamino)uracil reductase